MQDDFIGRLNDERMGLQTKLVKLKTFITNPKTKLSKANIILLKKQSKAMKEYLDILYIRIELIQTK